MSQLDNILNHMRSIGPDGKRRGLSPLEARALYQVESLSRRMCDLKDQGYNVLSEMRMAVNGKKFCRYYLASM